jgi:hypothetical protein
VTSWASSGVRCDRPTFDVPLLELALRTPAGYVGAMGSRRTHDDRLARLREVGLTEQELSHLRSPIGLDLGARTPEETAVSIAAELIQLRWGGSGQALTDTAGRIHHSLRWASKPEMPEAPAITRLLSASAPEIPKVSPIRKNGRGLLCRAHCPQKALVALERGGGAGGVSRDRSGLGVDVFRSLGVDRGLGG